MFKGHFLNLFVYCVVHVFPSLKIKKIIFLHIRGIIPLSVTYRQIFLPSVSFVFFLVMQNVFNVVKFINAFC